MSERLTRRSDRLKKTDSGTGLIGFNGRSPCFEFSDTNFGKLMKNMSADMRKKIRTVLENFKLRKKGTKSIPQ